MYLQKNVQYQTPHLTSTSHVLRVIIFFFEGLSSQIITEIPAEISCITMAKMGLSHLLNILEGGLGDVNELLVYKLRRAVLINMPPVFDCFFNDIGGNGESVG
jgi:hypothetical protein